ncbi:MAG: tetratricopeptide repeat protein [Pseudanabaenaceae cyanobacterium]
MVDFANVMEYAVLREAKAQLVATRLDGTLRLAEVAAWALNRLPALYVTSVEGYRYSLDRGTRGLAMDVAEAVRRGIQTLQAGDPLRDGTGLDGARFESARGLLPQLRQLFERAELRWQDLPKAVAQASELAPPPPLPQSAATSPERAYSWRVGSEVRMYLSRAKRKAPEVEPPKPNIELLATEHLELYLLQPQWGLVNWMETAAAQAVAEIVAAEFPLDGCPNPAEAIAYALNRLPGLYATSERGEAYCRERAAHVLARDIRIQARSGVVRVRCYPQRAVTAIPFGALEEECAAALVSLQRILAQDDLTLGNLIPAIQKACPSIREKFRKADLQKQGDRAWQRGDIPAAIVAYTQLEELDPQNPHVCLCLGLLWTESGDWLSAQAAFQAAIELGCTDVRVWFGSAEIWLRQQNYTEALRLYEQVLADDPQNLTALQGVAFCQQQQGQWEQAAHTYRQITALAPKEMMAYLQLGRVCLQQNALEEAAKALSRAEKLAPEHPDVAFELGALFAARGFLGSALQQYRRTIDLNPQHGEANYEMGKYLETRGRLDAALACYRQAALGKPTAKEIYRALARVYSRKNLVPGAIAAYRQILELDPQDAFAQFSLGALLSEQKAYSEAVKHLTIAQTLYAPTANVELQLEIRRLLEAARGHAPST